MSSQSDTTNTTTTTQTGIPVFKPPVQVCIDIDGNETNILYQEFIDKTFILVTQHRKMGCITLITEDVPGSLENSNNYLKTYTCNVLLGEDSPVTQVISRRFSESVGTTKPVLVSSSVKSQSKKTIDAICSALKDLKGKYIHNTGPR